MDGSVWSRFVQADNFGAAVMDSWIAPIGKGARNIRIEMDLDGANEKKRIEVRTGTTSKL